MDNVNNWVCSVANLSEMELCLFDSIVGNQQLIEFQYCLPAGKVHEFEGEDSFDLKNLQRKKLKYLDSSLTIDEALSLYQELIGEL